MGMDILELREARKALELELTGIVDQKMREFRNHTGMSPCSISVHLEDVTTVGESEPNFVVSLVEVRIPL